ncbi:expressed unknown protein [Seminavis robusta]|uniref:Uncharacterized protein n=1 Tax=Seminavis robusta TaxID=568900 RepID=A0A9N8HYC4_9STRA|nr:expressed unknown protein [Seminavis robusta]|eukprot:Sro2832_g338130.1 n/a (721) ;mRNA; r:6980-9233
MDNKKIQYYLPPGCCDDAQSLLEQEDLTEQDVLDFVSDGKLPEREDAGKEMRQALIDAYHERRREIRDLAWKFWQGQAFVDEDGRLVPVGENHNNEAGILQEAGGGQLPPLPNPVNNNNNGNNMAPPFLLAPANLMNGGGNNNNNGAINNNNNNNNDNNNNLGRNVDNRNNDNNDNFNMNAPVVNNNIPFPLDLEEEERRWTEEEEREAALAIARAVERYRQQAVPEEEFVLLRVPPMERPERASLTFRRICFAVLAVAVAFICIMLQTIPLFPRDKRPDPLFDKLLYELLHVRHFTDHARDCPDLNRSPLSKTLYPSWWTETQLFKPIEWLLSSYYYTSISSENQPELDVDCSDGVVHVPTKTVLVDSFFEASTKGQAAFWEPYLLGVNVSWFMPCNPPINASTMCQSPTRQQQEMTTTTNKDQSTDDDACPISEDPQHMEDHKCFRGIHDNLITDQDIGETLRMGAELIQVGWDHFDIHYDARYLRHLEGRLPALLETIRSLLRDTYRVGSNHTKLKPVAFRVSASGPLDGGNLPLRGSLSQTSSYLLRVLNRQRYVRWIEKHKRHNELARYSLPWPSTRREPFRDPCVLIADMEADPRFAIHTSVFLSTGAGHDFRGGVSLFVDDHPSNSNPRRKIQRGVTIDGSRGRLVVSTGGLENRRCRLPTREGIRAALQIWWSCEENNENNTDAMLGDEPLEKISDIVPSRSRLWPVFHDQK